MIEYPKSLPMPLRDDYGFQMVSPILRTEMQSGRSRQRRKFRSVPTATPVSWLLKDVQAQLFEAWWEDVLQSGNQYFLCPLKTPEGINQYVARFTGPYKGPILIADSHWKFEAELELRERPILAPGWALYAPEYVLMSALFDKAMNLEWPESKYQTYMSAFDEGVNEEWPNDSA